ncbi:hypothetical protein TIFTF001_030040 [Ficus carica]|uniref:Uncharacterized protein n=1 Tax=Ficus carica TaxID=3494 RepID=A0AA88DTF1_FICCA|nr:hypothetical protein TIFTF001_030040 [Ficus carica]
MVVFNKESQAFGTLVTHRRAREETNVGSWDPTDTWPAMSGELLQGGVHVENDRKRLTRACKKLAQREGCACQVRVCVGTARACVVF